MEILWLLVLIVAIHRTQSMACRNQAPTYATCTMQPLGNNAQANIHFMQPASCYGYDEPMMITVNMPGYPTPRGKPVQPHRMMVMQYGDISGGCQNTGAVFNPDIFHARSEPIGMLGAFPEPNGKPYSFLTKNGAQLTGDNSIIGRALVMFSGSDTNPVGCCVIGHAVGANSGQASRATQPHQRAFGIMNRPITSGSIFGDHPFFAGQNKGLSFGSQNNPQKTTGVFDLSFNDFSNLGRHPFGKNDFGGVLTPSLHHLDKPPSPPQFPGRKGFLGRSPLFGSMNHPISKSSANVAFGAGFNSIPGFSEEEKFIPTDGDEQPVPGSSNDKDPHQGQSQGQGQGQSVGPGYQGDNNQQGQDSGYQGPLEHHQNGEQGAYRGSQRNSADPSNTGYRDAPAGDVSNNGYQGDNRDAPARDVSNNGYQGDNRDASAGSVTNNGYQGNNRDAPASDVPSNGYQGNNRDAPAGDISNNGYQGDNRGGVNNAGYQGGSTHGVAVGEYHPNTGSSGNQNGGPPVVIATNRGTSSGYQGDNTGTGPVYQGDSSPPNSGVRIDYKPVGINQLSGGDQYQKNTVGGSPDTPQTGNNVPINIPDNENSYQSNIIQTPNPSQPTIGSAGQTHPYPPPISSGTQPASAPIQGHPDPYIPAATNINSPSQDSAPASNGNAYPSQDEGSTFGSYPPSAPKYIETPPYNTPYGTDSAGSATAGNPHNTGNIPPISNHGTPA